MLLAAIGVSVFPQVFRDYKNFAAATNAAGRRSREALDCALERPSVSITRAVNDFSKGDRALFKSSDGVCDSVAAAPCLKRLPNVPSEDFLKMVRFEAGNLGSRFSGQSQGTISFNPLT